MQDIINELNAGSTEYKEDGTVIHRPPSSLQLRAARNLTEMFNINQTNLLMINQMQSHISDLFKINNTLKAELDAARTIRREPTNSNEGLRNGGQEVSGVECGDTRPCASDSDSAGSSTDPNIITGSN